MFVGGLDESVKVWDLRMKLCLYELSTGNNNISDIDYHFGTNSLILSTNCHSFKLQPPNSSNSSNFVTYEQLNTQNPSENEQKPVQIKWPANAKHNPTDFGEIFDCNSNMIQFFKFDKNLPFVEPSIDEGKNLECRAVIDENYHENFSSTSETNFSHYSASNSYSNLNQSSGSHPFKKRRSSFTQPNVNIVGNSTQFESPMKKKRKISTNVNKIPQLPTNDVIVAPIPENPNQDFNIIDQQPPLVVSDFGAENLAENFEENMTNYQNMTADVKNFLVAKVCFFFML